MGRREFLREDDRCTGKQHAAGGDDASDRMKEGQAIIQTIVGIGARQTGKPTAPIEYAAMADACRLRQPGRAGGIDQECAIVDGGLAPLGGRERSRVEFSKNVVNARAAADVP